jgi:hypothetical protein
MRLKNATKSIMCDELGGSTSRSVANKDIHIVTSKIKRGQIPRMDDP